MPTSKRKRTHHFGRAPRAFNPRIPHYSALAAGITLPAPPAAIDYTSNMPDDFGMMLNDNLGDCTCAAYYHARQVWTFQAQGGEVTEPDDDVLDLYIEGCGYDPDVPGPGPGGNEQAVLTYLLQSGAPVGADGSSRDNILAFVEVDSRNVDDVKRTIYDCGVAYIGFQVPSDVNFDNPVWDYDPATPMTNDGHAVVLAGYDADGAIVISWGKRFRMTWSFVTNVVDEVYAIADGAWIESGGNTPAGMSLAQLEAQMQALRSANVGASYAFQSKRSEARYANRPVPNRPKRK